VKARAAREVVLGVRAFHRYLGQRRGARLLEHDAEQHRVPVDAAAVLGGQGIDLLRPEVAVGRGKIEIEIDWVHDRQ
jgi:hypothetical protein